VLILYARSDVSGRVSLGDIVVSVENRTVRSIEDLFRALDQKKPGQTAKLQLLRSFGGELSQFITLESVSLCARQFRRKPSGMGIAEGGEEGRELARSLRKVEVEVRLAGR